MKEKLKPECLWINVEHMHMLHPDTFYIPPRWQREEIKPGDAIKVGVTFPKIKDGCEGERFWVYVMAKKDGQVAGPIANKLSFTPDHGLEQGEWVEVGIENILDITPNSEHQSEYWRLSSSGYLNRQYSSNSEVVTQ